MTNSAYAKKTLKMTYSVKLYFISDNDLFLILNALSMNSQQQIYCI